MDRVQLLRSRSHALCRRPAPEPAFRAGLPRRAKERVSPANLELEHIGFGTMNGPDGKPFKTRAGGVMRLQRPDRHGDRTGDDPPAGGRAGSRLPGGGARADRPHGGHRGDQVRRSEQSPAVQLHLRSRPVHPVRRSNRALSAIRRGAHQIPAAQSGNAGGGAGTRFCAADRYRAGSRSCCWDNCRMPSPWRSPGRAPNELCEFAFRLAQEYSRFYGACHILSEVRYMRCGARDLATCPGLCCARSRCCCHYLG